MKEGEVSFRYRNIPGILRIVVALFSIAGIGVAVFFIFRLTLFGNSFLENGYYFMLMALLLPPLFYMCRPRLKGLMPKSPGMITWLRC